MSVKQSILELIGNTPLVRLNRVATGGGATVLVKLEQFNPMTSIKDRPALAMIEAAEREGRLRPGATIVEATSGNTGLALAMVGAVKGYRVVLIVEEIDRLRTFVETAEAFGAEVVTVSSFLKAVALAEQMQRDDPFNVFVPQQFRNPANPACHEVGTAAEILGEVGDRLVAFVGGCGSGGTITGVGRALKRAVGGVKVVLAEPDTVGIFAGGARGCSEIHGVGPMFQPDVMDASILDEVIQVKVGDAHAMMRRLAREEGILGGPSAGALVWAAVQVARRHRQGDIVVTLIPDFGMRYLAIGLFDPEHWLVEPAALGDAA